MGYKSYKRQGTILFSALTATTCDLQLHCDHALHELDVTARLGGTGQVAGKSRGEKSWRRLVGQSSLRVHLLDCRTDDPEYTRWENNQHHFRRSGLCEFIYPSGLRVHNLWHAILHLPTYTPSSLDRIKTISHGDGLSKHMNKALNSRKGRLTLPRPRSGWSIRSRSCLVSQLVSPPVIHIRTYVGGLWLLEGIDLQFQPSLAGRFSLIIIFFSLPLQLME